MLFFGTPAALAPGLMLLFARSALVPTGPLVARAAVPRCCAEAPPSAPAPPPAASPPSAPADMQTSASAGGAMLGAPRSLDELRERVQRDLTHTGDAEIMRAHAQAITTGVSGLMEMFSEAEAQGASISAIVASGEPYFPKSLLDAKLAAQLPLLMRPEFGQFMRTALDKVRAPTQQLALLELNRYVLGAYEEVADGVVDLQWTQINKLREL